MQPARRHIGGNQQTQVAFNEAREQALAFLLRYITGEHTDLVTGAFERQRHALTTKLCIHEHHRAIGVHAAEQTEQ